jgi:hypothetical protein
MSQPPVVETYPEPPAAALGVVEALGMGWRLMKADFWPLWTVALVLVLLQMASSCVPFGYFVAFPPLAAGFVYVLVRRIDGGAVQTGNLFEGFRQRFSESLLSMLPLLIVWAVSWIAEMVLYFVFFLPVMMLSSSSTGDHEGEMDAMMAVAFGILGLVVMLVSIAVAVFQMFFIFAPMAVWERPRAGWEAAKDSMRLVRSHFWSVLGFCLLGFVIFIAAEIAGILACCIGIIFSIPAVCVWLGAAAVYLYRSYTGQPLVQPVAGGDAAPDLWPLPPQDAGPIPPTSVEPPAGPQR